MSPVFHKNLQKRNFELSRILFYRRSFVYLVKQFQIFFFSFKDDLSVHIAYVFILVRDQFSFGAVNILNVKNVFREVRC